MADRFSLVRPSCGWESAIQQWLGPRAYRIISQRSDVEQLPWTAIVMSHRNRNPELSADWRVAVEKALQYCRSSHSLLLVSDSTPLGPFLIHAANRIQIPLVQLRLPLARESRNEWTQRVRDAMSHSESSETQLWVSPIDDAAALQDANDPSASAPPLCTDFETLPLVDRALIALADKVQVISVAPGSKTERLIRLRLDDARFPTASVFVAMKHPAKPASIAAHENLLDHGAVGWLHPPSVDESTIEACGSPRVHLSQASSSDIASQVSTHVPWFKYTLQTHSSSEAWPYLSHCTRARTGPWPDQSKVGYYDSLIASRHGDDLNATAFDTLKRILLQQRLVASSDLNRSGMPTVSLTAVPLQTLLPRRQFQSHLGRWDWESYGICIHRRWAEQNGGRRVLYSSAVDWKKLSPQDRPFFQPTCDDENPDRSDWEREQEWRIVGDIHLADIPFESAFVFVPTKREAAQLATICRFPIMVV